MKRIAAAVGAAALALSAVPAASATASTTPYCGISWGSLQKYDADMSAAHVTNVRAGQQPCFDRMVIDLAGKVAGYNVRYVDQVTSPGSGFTVPVSGGARLQVTVTAPAYNGWGSPTYWPADRSNVVNVSGWQTFRQIRYVNSYEGYTDFGLGVRARLPFRAFILDGPYGGSRLVIDVAHFW